MLDPLLEFLQAYEAVISAAVGLLTLTAAIWGAVRIAVNRKSRTGTRSAATSRITWRRLLDLGLQDHSRLEELVSVRTVNVALFCLGAVSFPWLVVSIVSEKMLPLTVMNLAVFTLALLGFALQWSGSTTAARWLLLIVACAYWMGSLLAVGAMAGTEYFLAALLALPVLLFSRVQRFQLFAAVFLILLVFVIGVILSQQTAPTIVFEADVARLGYNANAVLLAVMLFAVVNFYQKFAAGSYSSLQSKKAKNEEIVAQLVPPRLARRIEDPHESLTDWHPDAMIVVVSIRGFSSLYERVPAMQSVEKLASLFAGFDQIVLERGIDKVKTLGTSYVAAAGIGDRAADYRAVASAVATMHAAAMDFAAREQLTLTFHCGIASGAVISGIVSHSRTGFDVLGGALEAAIDLCSKAPPHTVYMDQSSHWRLGDVCDSHPVEAPANSYGVTLQ